MSYSKEFKLRVVEFYLSGQESLQQVADRFLLCRKTIWRWIKRYKNEGRNSLINRKKTTTTKLERYKDQILDLVRENPGLTLSEYKKLIKEKFGTDVTRTGIHYFLERWELPFFKRVRLYKKLLREKKLTNKEKRKKSKTNKYYRNYYNYNKYNKYNKYKKRSWWKNRKNWKKN